MEAQHASYSCDFFRRATRENPSKLVHGHLVSPHLRICEIALRIRPGTATEFAFFDDDGLYSFFDPSHEAVVRRPGVELFRDAQGRNGRFVHGDSSLLIRRQSPNEPRIRHELSGDIRRRISLHVLTIVFPRLHVRNRRDAILGVYDGSRDAHRCLAHSFERHFSVIEKNLDALSLRDISLYYYGLDDDLGDFYHAGLHYFSHNRIYGRFLDCLTRNRIEIYLDRFAHGSRRFRVKSFHVGGYKVRVQKREQRKPAVHAHGGVRFQAGAERTARSRERDSCLVRRCQSDFSVGGHFAQRRLCVFPREDTDDPLSTLVKIYDYGFSDGKFVIFRLWDLFSVGRFSWRLMRGRLCEPPARL